ncbi:uncharacterized protein BDZ83DRAFT_597524 [Colletotrichum acutatum]|uniref:Secreted protein n=1 Tax=Glomerella acutata TaxID=27357 RepID=A0AAD8XQA2_GLOAC|nr:uncharacterized protein BDZ83DRAFT_597524 [Colletotrichum acutatum]KAK1731444.1 hypothetical protein BDZ83DRAFT_597524 [Colletotrichum acutatum]
MVLLLTLALPFWGWFRGGGRSVYGLHIADGYDETPTKARTRYFLVGTKVARTIFQIGFFSSPVVEERETWQV